MQDAPVIEAYEQGGHQIEVRHAGTISLLHGPAETFYIRCTKCGISHFSRTGSSNLDAVSCPPPPNYFKKEDAMTQRNAMETTET